jgi:hypothetical protein
VDDFDFLLVMLLLLDFSRLAFGLTDSGVLVAFDPASRLLSCTVGRLGTDD